MKGKELKEIENYGEKDQRKKEMWALGLLLIQFLL